MTDLGFKFNSPDDNDMYFTGSVRDEQAVVLTQFNDKDQLSRIVVVFDTRNIVSLYSGLKDHLDSKYGESEDKNEVIPFNNDAEVSKAILQGKTVSSIWVYPAYLPLYFLTLRLTKPYVGDDSIHVTLEYQSPAWVDESKRRTRNSDL